MKAYRLTVNLKLGLIVFAVLIAIASLAYTNSFVDRLRDREQSVIKLWADALAQLAEAQRLSNNPYHQEFIEMEVLLSQPDGGGGLSISLSEAQVEAFREAVEWAQGMPPASELNFITNAILVPNDFDIPAIITNAADGEPVFWRNLPIPAQDQLAGLDAEERAEILERLQEILRTMDDTYMPITIEAAEGQLRQRVHYGESGLVRELRIFPYVQLGFVALFILVGYLGFSYVRRSEQSSLWVGMAKEAAHQLGTPISSLMGWTELLKYGEMPPPQQREALEEIENDIQRLRRVANRFSDIGSLPKLEVLPLAPAVEATADYIRRRIPQQSKHVTLDVDVPPDLASPLNVELFEWVIENLLKNALDAIETKSGGIEITAFQRDGRNYIDVRDTGKGIDRRQWKNVFRPGYSTKKRGWGLGLSLAKRIVEDYHGGALTLEQSRVGHGTTFRIMLPAAEDHAATVPPPRPRAAVEGS